jgi:DNA-directed RNA polymerase subunit RPC12/RpoP
MSFQQFQQKCADCEKEWNAAFGIVGTTIIAQAPSECPHCKSTKLETIAYGWKIEPIENSSK